MLLMLVILYSRTYRNVSADALARNSVQQSGEWAFANGSARVGIPEIRETFRKSISPGELPRIWWHICFNPRSDIGLSDVEWAPGSY